MMNKSGCFYRLLLCTSIRYSEYLRIVLFSDERMFRISGVMNIQIVGTLRTDHPQDYNRVVLNSQAL